MSTEDLDQLRANVEATAIAHAIAEVECGVPLFPTPAMAAEQEAFQAMLVAKSEFQKALRAKRMRDAEEGDKQ